MTQSQHDRPHSVVLAGGGTAGHVSPLLALADELRRRDPQVQITVLGTDSGLETRLVPSRGYELRTIPKAVFPRKPSGALLRLPSLLKGAVDATGVILDEVGADLVVGFGGYVSTPAYLAARRRHLPVVVHEQNVRPGLANRLGSRLTPWVATTFAATQLPGARHLGMPLRSEITGLDLGSLRAQAREELGLRADLPTILVTGGSSGAKRLNDTFEARARALSDAGIQVLHVTGRGKMFAAPQLAGGAPYVLMEYSDRMDLAYAAADLVVSRAGAGMVCELTAIGLPAVYVPLPIGNGEQRFNVAEVVEAGGGIVVADDELTPQWVDQTLIPLVHDGDRLRAMAAAASRVGVRDGDGLLADLVEEAFTDSERKER